MNKVVFDIKLNVVTEADNVNDVIVAFRDIIASKLKDSNTTVIRTDNKTTYVKVREK